MDEALLKTTVLKLFKEDAGFRDEVFKSIGDEVRAVAKDFAGRETAKIEKSLKPINEKLAGYDERIEAAGKPKDPEPEMLSLQSLNKKLEQKFADEAKARQAAEAEAREERINAGLTAALEGVQVKKALRGPLIAHLGKTAQIEYDKRARQVMVDGKPAIDWAAEFVSTDEGKEYLAPLPVAGTGSGVGTAGALGVVGAGGPTPEQVAAAERRFLGG